MNSPATKKRLWFIGLGVAVLLVALLFVSVFAPNPHPGEQQPSIQTSSPAVGQASTPAGAAPAASKGSQGFGFGGSDAVSLVWRLGLVTIVIAVAIVGLRWWGRRQASPRSVTGFLKVVDTLAISNGRSIHLVALGERVIAVGATAQQLSMLDELTDDEARHVLDGVAHPQHQPMATFAAELFDSLRNGRVRPRRQDESVIGAEGPV